MCSSCGMCYLSHDAHKVHGWLTIDKPMIMHTQVCFACRPDYKKLGVLKQQFPDVPILALTATATQRVREVYCAPLLRQAKLCVSARFSPGT